MKNNLEQSFDRKREVKIVNLIFWKLHFKLLSFRFEQLLQKLFHEFMTFSNTQTLKWRNKIGYKNMPWKHNINNSQSIAWTNNTDK